MRLLFLTCLTMATAGFVSAEGTHQPYKGLEKRAISSLSADDIAQLEAGQGWGLALPAELNGYPGPLHVLELAKQLDLTDAQHAQITAIFEKMREEAVEKGAALIKAERALDNGFQSGGLSADSLKALIDQANSARAELRFVHLSRHLAVKELLSDQQVETYARLRGYSDDPCASVPEGHNPAMWRKHNGCSDEG